MGETREGKREKRGENKKGKKGRKKGKKGSCQERMFGVQFQGLALTCLYLPQPKNLQCIWDHNINSFPKQSL